MNIKTGLYSDEAYIELMKAQDKLERAESSKMLGKFSKLVKIIRNDDCEVVIFVSDDSHYFASRRRRVKDYNYHYETRYRKNGESYEHRVRDRWDGHSYKTIEINGRLANPYSSEKGDENQRSVRFIKSYCKEIKVFIPPVLFNKLVGRKMKTTDELNKLIGTPHEPSKISYYDGSCKSRFIDESNLYREARYNIVKDTLDMISRFGHPTTVKKVFNFVDLYPGTVVEVPTLDGVEKFTILNVKAVRSNNSPIIQIDFDRGTSTYEVSDSYPWRTINYLAGYISGSEFVFIENDRSWNTFRIKMKANSSTEPDCGCTCSPG